MAVWYTHPPEVKVRRTPPRMLMLLGWRRLRYPRPRTVLWGHRRFDHSPRGLEVIGPAEAAPVRERFCAWLRELGLEPDEVYEIEAGTVGMRVHRWARDEDGRILVVEGCLRRAGIRRSRRTAFASQRYTSRRR